MHHHRILDEQFEFETGGVLEVVGEEAQHAVRSKRLGVGDHVGLMDGRGVIADAVIEGVDKTGSKGKAEWHVRLRVLEVEAFEPVHPAVEVCAASPKGPRLEGMIEQLSQAGAARWRPLVSERTVVDPREGKLERTARVAHESAKQCARPHVLEIGRRVGFAAALEGDGATVVMADAGGRPPSAVLSPSVDAIRLLVGPEGGWSPTEREMAAAAGVGVVDLGPHVFRTETAAVAGVALILDATRGDRSA